MPLTSLSVSAAQRHQTGLRSSCSIVDGQMTAVWDFAAVHDELANDGYRFTAFADTFEEMKR